MDANLFTEGSIYYYENTTHTKSDYHDSSINQDFLVSRPVYILKSNPTPFDTFTISVLPITSSLHRVGIQINIDGCKNGKILPYAIHSVHKEYLTTYMGRVSNELISTVNEAVKYHQGYNDDVPQYILDYLHREDQINNLSVKERTIFDFIENKCSLNSNYYADFDELYRYYIKIYGSKGGYTRTQDFSRTLNKILKLYPSIDLKVENQVKKYYGISIYGNTHKINKPEEKIQTTRNAENGNLKLPNSQLRKLISDESAKIYDKLDIIQKISNYYSSSDNMDINGIPLQDKAVVKRMIENDVDKRKSKVLSTMSNGVHPLNMNDVDQYIIYICTDTEILNNLSKKHCKPGGVNRIKKMIRPNIKHFFSRVKVE